MALHSCDQCLIVASYRGRAVSQRCASGRRKPASIIAPTTTCASGTLLFTPSATSRGVPAAHLCVGMCMFDLSGFHCAQCQLQGLTGHTPCWEPWCWRVYSIRLHGAATLLAAIRCSDEDKTEIMQRLVVEGGRWKQHAPKYKESVNCVPMKSALKGRLRGGAATCFRPLERATLFNPWQNAPSNAGRSTGQVN